MHATADLSNVKARLFVYAATLSLTGSPVIAYEGQGAHRERVAASGPFVRWTVEFTPGLPSGRWDSNEIATREAVVIVADLFWPTSTADAYQIDRAASEIADALRVLSLSFEDYAIPAAPVASSSRLRVLSPPTVQRLGTIEGEDRRRVSAIVTWISRHTA